MSYTPLARLTLFLCLLAVISLQAAPQPLILWYDSDAGTSFTKAIKFQNRLQVTHHRFKSRPL